MLRLNKQIIFLFLCCLLIGQSWANENTDKENVIYSLSNAREGIILKSFYLIDNNLSIEQLPELKDSDWIEKEHFKKKDWIDRTWQKTLIYNAGQNNIESVLILDRSFTVPTQFYFKENNQWQSIALGEFQSPLHINFIYPSFNVTLKPGLNEFYFHYLSTKSEPAAILYSPKAYAEVGFLKISIIILILGMVILMAIYNLVIFIVEREKEYAFYLLYLSSVFALTIELSGIERFYTESPHLHYGPNLVAIPPIFLALFYISMFDWKKDFKYVYYQTILIIYISVAYTVFALFASEQLKFTTYALYLPVMSYVSLLGLYALSIESYRGSRQAFLLLFGLIILLLGTVISQSALTGALPEIFVYASIFAFASEMTLFSFALSVRKQERLVAEVNAKKHSYGQLAKVFYPHQLQQMQEGQILEQTMPEGEADAAVIAFDVAGSSQIKDPHVKDFLHKVMKACEMEMVKNYEPYLMTADAYRVKEMGDGFLCSTGFPFFTPEGKEPALTSWELALRFVQAFHRVEKEFAYSEPLFCGIGIAYDQIEAYFPSSGVRQYDLYGRSIVLATRYESYRKMLFEQINEVGSVIIVQERLYKMLPEEAQEKLKAFDLTQSKYKIRDDYSAEKLYYKVFTSDEIH